MMAPAKEASHDVLALLFLNSNSLESINKTLEDMSRRVCGVDSFQEGISLDNLHSAEDSTYFTASLFSNVQLKACLVLIKELLFTRTPNVCC